ncbi:unnamed protein product [Prorocentrum cordatum]|uniref:Uncharacterized protein n=1 Tax=Prorocentrum cordatum TaxID=2364126 RepID=A0ABN9ST64_9DINO|nr:unnamed protein product [Polarella glacialis]
MRSLLVLGLERDPGRQGETMRSDVTRENTTLPDLPAGRSRCWGTAGPPTAAAPIPRRRPRPRSPARQGEGPREAQGQRPSGSVFAERDGQRRHRCAERAAPPEADPGAESRWGGAAVTGAHRGVLCPARGHELRRAARAVRPGSSGRPREGRAGVERGQSRQHEWRGSRRKERMRERMKASEMLRTSEWWVRGWISRPTSLKHFFKRLRWPRQHSPQPRRQAWPRVPPPPGGQASGIPKKLARRRRGDGVTGSHKEQPVLGDEQRGTPDRARSP